MKVVCVLGQGSDIGVGGGEFNCSEFLRWPKSHKLISECFAASTQPNNLCSW